MYYMIKYYPEIETCTQEKEGDRVEKEKEIQSAIDEDFGDTKLGRLRYFFFTNLGNCSLHCMRRVNFQMIPNFIWSADHLVIFLDMQSEIPTILP